MDILRCYLQFGRWAKRTLLKPLKYAAVVVLAAIVVLSITSVLPIPGNFKSLVVMSGSMAPTIRVGSVAYIKAADEIKMGDIVTFKNPRDPTTSFTHRVISIEEGKIKTKGDANNAPDSWELTKENIIGKFIFSIPLLGYAVHFARMPQGFLFLVIVPAILIILSELRVIKDEFKKKHVSKQAPLLLLFGATVFAFGATYAYFSDTEISTGNTLSAGTWGPRIVINEFMPDPSMVDDADGEWFELYNAGDESVNLNGWEIKDNNSDSHTINSDLIIAAGNYAVLCRNGNSASNGGVTCNYEYSGFILANDAADEIILKNGSGNEKDRVEYTDAFPYEGGYSAELKDPDLDNNNQANWEKAADGDTYGGGDHGTPGAAN